jgi:hypothetical protein
MLCSSTDSSMVDIINGATERVVYVAPGVSKAVAEALVRAVTRVTGGSVQVCIDADPNAVRMGYGTVEGLAVLHAAAQVSGRLALNRLQGLRVGVLVADQITMVFTPMPLSIESPNEERAKTNAMLLAAGDGIGPDAVLDSAKDHGVLRLTAEELGRTTKNLVDHPPVRFDIARSMQVFNAHYEFVELSVTGCNLERKTIPVPAELQGLADTVLGKQFRSHVRLIGGDHHHLDREVKALRFLIEERYFIHVPTYGTLIWRGDRREFDASVDQLRRSVLALQVAFSAGIQRSMNETRNALKQHLLLSVEKRIPATWAKDLGPFPTGAEIAQYLDQELQSRFTKAQEDMAKAMTVQVIFKGITWEMLQSDDFRDRLARSPKGASVLKHLHSVTQVVPIDAPL